MQLQIKTINQKTLVIDVEETKTIYDLKKELALHPDVGVTPDFMLLIYAGKILSNYKILSMCNIDVKKPLVLMRLRWRLHRRMRIVAPTLKIEDLMEPPTPTTQEEEKELKKKASHTCAHLMVLMLKGLDFSRSAMRRALWPLGQAVELYLQREPLFKLCNQSVRKKPEHLLNIVIGRMLPSIFRYMEHRPARFVGTWESSDERKQRDDDNKDDENKSDKNE